jgi:hypothetical protein
MRFPVQCSQSFGVSNWEDKPREVEVELGALGLAPRAEYHAYEFWSQKYLGVVKRRLTLPKLRAHETALLLFKRVSKRVELLTTTFHIAQGLVEVAQVERVGATLVVALEKAGVQRGEVLFAVPPARKITSARVNNNPARVHKIARGIYAVRLRLEGKARVEVEAR